MMERKARAWRVGLALASVCLLAIGCGDDSSGRGESKRKRESVSNEPAGPALSGTAIDAARDAAADLAVSAELGGKGFTGKDWLTADPQPLGDPRARKGGEIRYPIRDWPGNLRMAGTAYNTWLNYTVRDLCYMGLLNMDPNTLEYLPGIASHWWISDDKMTFRYRIDPRAKWSDGKPIVAEDVVASWKIRMDKTLLDPSAIVTYGKLHQPEAKSKYIVEVKAKDKNWRNFLYFSGMGIFPAHEIGAISGKDYLEKYNYAYTAFSGPYKVEPADIAKGESLTLTRRDDWWCKDDRVNVGMYNFNKIRFVVVLNNPELAFQKTCKGEFDFFMLQKSDWWAVDLPRMPEVEKGWLVRQKVFNDAPNGIKGLALNTRQAPLDDVRVRKALQLVYDRKTLIEKLAFNEYVPMNSYYAGGEYENPANEKLEYDPKRAVELLAEAGWKTRGGDGVLTKDGKRLSLNLLWYSPIRERFLTSFKESCSKAGIEILLERIDPESLWKNLMERKFVMVDMAWGALVFPNPETSFLSSLADQNDNNNITGFKNTRCDELFKQYDVAFTQDERRKIVREVDGIVYKDHPYVLEWYQPCQRILYWNKFGMPEFGLHRTLEYEDVFATWWIDPEKLKALSAARKEGSSLPVPPLENRYWEERRKATQTAAN